MTAEEDGVVVPVSSSAGAEIGGRKDLHGGVTNYKGIKHPLRVL